MNIPTAFYVSSFYGLHMIPLKERSAPSIHDFHEESSKLDNDSRRLDYYFALDAFTCTEDSGSGRV